MKSRLWQCLVLSAALAPVVFADGDTVSLDVAGGRATLQLPRIPGTDQYKVYGTSDLNFNFSELLSGLVTGFTWSDLATTPQAFYRVGAVPMSPQDTMTALVLNRLAYGPTPDELERVKAMGPDAYIAEQLAPETISESLDIDRVNLTGDWQRVITTGIASGSDFYIYLTTAGDAYLDDIKLVAGSSADVGANLFANPGFETALTGPWTVSENHSNSVIVATGTHTGVGALHIIATEGGSSRSSSIWQTTSGVTVGNTYTLSYWWKPGSSAIPPLTLRFSNSGIVSNPGSLAGMLSSRVAAIADLRAWHVQHAVRSKKQLEETMLQWLENHFVTQYSKSVDYFDRYLDDGEPGAWATYLEYKENQKWRAALEQPACTFSNLLSISAESPAMILYLDTIDSKGNGSNIPNENYARELLELFTFGVDNGYDQNDIVLMSRVWTGWSVEIVATNNEANPLAPMSTTLRPGGTNINDRGQLAGVWSFKYRPGNHWTRSGTILFPGKTVPDRFGPPYAGRSYEFGVDIDSNPTRDWQQVVMTGTASSSSLYMYLNEPGDIYLDDIKIVAGSVPEVGANRVVNGDFETALTGPWNVSPNLATSAIVAGGAHGGTRSLHVIADSAGSTRDSSIYQTTSALTSGATYTLSFWWKPGTNLVTGSTIRLSGSGLVATAPQRSGGDGLADGYKVIGHLSDLPFTQEFISVKLCRLFVHDHFETGYDFTDPNLSPEGHLVRACMDAWENNTPKGQIRKVMQVIFNSELFRSQGSAMHKVRTPLEYTVASIRALRSENTDGTATASTDGYSAVNAISRMGSMSLFNRAEPDGYPEAAAPWISAGTLAERLRWVQSLTIVSTGSGRGDAGSSVNNPVALLKKKLPSAKWKDADAVADYFLGILLPGEGKANLDLYKQAAVSFLNTADNGTTPSLFSGLTDTAANYDTRVRGMVGAIMTSQRFHEQ